MHALFVEREPTLKMEPPVAPNVPVELPHCVPERHILMHAVRYNLLGLEKKHYIRLIVTFLCAFLKSLHFLWQSVRLVFSQTRVTLKDVRLVQPTHTLKIWVKKSAPCVQWAQLLQLIVQSAVSCILIESLLKCIFEREHNKW